MVEFCHFPPLPLSWVFSQNGEKIAQEVKINNTGNSSLQGTKGQERRQYGEVLPPPSKGKGCLATQK